MKYSIDFDAIKISQPVGDFYCGVMNAADVSKIAEADVRRIKEDDVGKYEGEGRKIASILDGQHRLAGFNESNFEFESPDGSKSPFQLLVTIFVGADISTQAGIFATVNLAQTKVNKSLVYDLQALAEARSPERTCHDIAVILNKELKSPFYRSIKRLGVATPGVKGEFLTQAAFVENVVKLISPNPKEDRDYFLSESRFWNKKKELSHLDKESLKKYFFRKAFIEDRDEVIASNLLNFFNAVNSKWQSRA